MEGRNAKAQHDQYRHAKRPIKEIHFGGKMKYVQVME